MWYYGIIILARWLGSPVVRALDSRLDGRGFNSWPPRQILGCVTVIGQEKPPQYFTKQSRPTQPPTDGRTGNDYQLCGDALRCGLKAGMVYSTCG